MHRLVCNAVLFIGILQACHTQAIAQLVVDAGPDQFVVSGNPPSPVTLAGQVRENGNLVYGLTVQWLKLSGPGEFTTTDQNRAITTAYFSEPGTYNLRLTAIDNPPVPTWQNPSDGSSYSRQVIIRASATDDIRVRRIELYFDSEVLSVTSNVTSISYTLDLRPKRYKLGPHALMVKACDDMGLCGDNTITVYKVR